MCYNESTSLNHWCLQRHNYNLESPLYLRVDVHVLLQTDCVAERFSTDAAAKRSRSTVWPPDVNLQPVGCREHLKQSLSISKFPLCLFDVFTCLAVYIHGPEIGPPWWCAPCHRWCSGRCWRWESSECCSPGAAEAAGSGWCACRTGWWRAAAPWGWNSSDGARRRTAPAPRHTPACSKEGIQPCEALRVQSDKQNTF